MSSAVSLGYVLKADAVFKRFSHKSIVCHG